jgi:anti-sigma regulatory factor (Ser/Thr protein kinase)
VLLASDDASLVTAIFGVLDPVTLAFEYGCAGHPPPIVTTADGRANVLPGIGSSVPLGVFPGVEPPLQRVQLAPGAMLTLFTDGVIERERDVISGIAALERTTEAIALAGTPEAARALDRAIFGEGEDERADDAAIMTVTLAPVVAHVDVRLRAAPESVAEARVAMRRFIAGLGVPEDVAYAMLLSAGEAVSNAVEHAYADHTEPETIDLRARRRGDGVEITVEDRGRWRPGSGDPERGRGIALMRAFASSIEIDDVECGTRVLLRFGLTSLPAPMQPVR